MSVAFSHPGKKVEFFKGGSNLRDSTRYKEVRLANDLTRTEREMEKKLVLKGQGLEREMFGGIPVPNKRPTVGEKGGKNQNKRPGVGVSRNVNSDPVQTINKLSVFYTNADQFRNKFNEFQLRVRDTRPMVIGITEVKAKNNVNIPNPAEYTMDWSEDYNMFHVNIDNCTGRGLLLYVHNSMQVEEVRLTVAFEENLFVKIKVNNTDCLLVGLI